MSCIIYRARDGFSHTFLDLLVIQPPLEKILAAGGKDQDLSDMTRASVVLAVSAMDAYFTGVFAERLVPYLKKHNPSKRLVELLEKAGLDTATSLHLLGMERPYRRVRALMDYYLAARTTQRFHVIDELFLAYGLKDLCLHAQKKTRRKTLLRSIEILIQRRHEIVHKGDLNGRGKIQEIDDNEVRVRILNIVKFVSAADEILISQIK